VSLHAPAKKQSRSRLPKQRESAADYGDKRSHFGDEEQERMEHFDVSLPI
jgi:hypothetical protein